jgi:hypothetical protein
VAINHARLAVAFAVVASVNACTNRQATRDDGPIAVRSMDTPAAPGSGEPSLTVTNEGRVLLSWIEPVGEKRHALRYAARTDGGRWSVATTIAEGPNWFVNWADFPSVSALPDGTLFAHWLAKSGPGTYAYDVRIATSRDGGRTWNAPVVPHRDHTQTEHGFVSMTPWTAEQMGIVWLDGRNTTGASHDGHGGAGAEMSLMHTTLTADGRLGPETELDDRVCDCCQTDAVQTQGSTIVVYRDRSPKEIRDMSVVRFVDGRWLPPQSLAADGWEINGCPVNGPAIAAAGANLAVAWFAAPADKARVTVAFSGDAGATFGSPIRVDDERPLGRVDVVLLDGDDALVAWLEQVGASASLRVRRVGADGSRGEAITIAESSHARSSGFPRMALSGREVTIAWRDAAEPPKVRSAVLAIGATGD